jgi:hypothetical protein
MLVLLASVLVEDHLFEEAGPHRRSSNYCVPLRDSINALRGIKMLVSAMSTREAPTGVLRRGERVSERVVEQFMSKHIDYSRVISAVASVWDKYTSVNLTRLLDLGTIEFRHLEGCYEEDRLNRWVDLITSVWGCSAYLGDLEYFPEFVRSRTGIEPTDTALAMFRILMNEEEL